MNKEVEILTTKEVVLLNEMKDNCLNGGKYKDEKAKDKFYMLCHLEDFTIKHDELQQENKQLKEKIDETIKCIDYYAVETDDYTKLYNNEEIDILKILRGEELENGEDNEENKDKR